MRRFVPWFALAVLALTAGIVGAAPTHMSSKPEIGGYCPVAYVAAGKAVKGDSKYTSVAGGHLFYFTGAQAKAMFDADPSKFQVAYGGLCPVHLAKGQKVQGDPKLFTVRDGRTYLFSSAASKRAFDANPDEIISGADAHQAGHAMQMKMK